MRRVLLPLIAAIALTFLFVGCGDHEHRIVTPGNPSGGNNAGFSNASLNGTYIFTIHGVNRRNLTVFDVTGNFVADGSGNITGGVQDSVDDSGRRTLNESITGTYFVNQDGRGQAIINTNSNINSSSGHVILRFVLESPASGKLFQIGTTSNSVRIDAVGTIELQIGSPATPASAYIVRLDGEDVFFNTFGAVGRIVFTGSNINGLLDENDGGTFRANQNTTGNITSFSSGRATATLTVNGSAHQLAVYFVSPTKVELIGTDTNILLQGNAEAQGSFASTTSAFAAAAPQQVFALAGVDACGSLPCPRVEVGRMTLASDGSLQNAIEDIENNLNPSYFAAVDFSGSTYSVGSNGRWTANLSNSSGAPSSDLVGWQISTQRSVVLTTNNTIVATGNMRAQTLGLTTASVSGNFAEALSGFEIFFGANLELTANLLLDGLGAMDGRFDSQDDRTGLNLNVATTGTYSIDPTSGRSTGGNIDAYDASSAGNVIPASGLPVVYYAVDSKFVYFLPSRLGSIYLGTLIGQTP